MIRQDEIDVARRAVLKAVRTNIRLKHSLAADEEINEILPDIEERFNRRVAAGELVQLQLNPGGILDE